MRGTAVFTLSHKAMRQGIEIASLVGIMRGTAVFTLSHKAMRQGIEIASLRWALSDAGSNGGFYER